MRAAEIVVCGRYSSMVHFPDPFGEEMVISPEFEKITALLGISVDAVSLVRRLFDQERSAQIYAVYRSGSVKENYLVIDTEFTPQDPDEPTLFIFHSAPETAKELRRCCFAWYETMFENCGGNDSVTFQERAGSYIPFCEFDFSKSPEDVQAQYKSAKKRPKKLYLIEDGTLLLKPHLLMGTVQCREKYRKEPIDD